MVRINPFRIFDGSYQSRIFDRLYHLGHLMVRIIPFRTFDGSHHFIRTFDRSYHSIEDILPISFHLGHLTDIIPFKIFDVSYHSI